MRVAVASALFISVLVSLTLQAQPRACDLLTRNGLIVDGTGSTCSGLVRLGGRRSCTADGSSSSERQLPLP